MKRRTFAKFYLCLCIPGSKLQFQAYQDSEVTAYGEPYDFGSILHYGMFDFGKDPKVWTIQPKPQYSNNGSKMGQRTALSPIDIKKINAMYKCENSGNETGSADDRNLSTVYATSV